MAVPLVTMSVVVHAMWVVMMRVIAVPAPLHWAWSARIIAEHQ